MIISNKEKKNKKKNRVSGLTKGGGLTREGSLTIEASLALTIFIFTVICLIMPMKMLDTQRKVQMVLESTSKELSQYAYIQYRLSEGDPDIGKKQQEKSSDIMPFFTGAAVGVYLSSKINAAVGDGKIEKMNFSKTRISENGEEVSLHVEYRLKLPFSVFAIKSVPTVSGSNRRGWIGSEGGRSELNRDAQNEDEVMVYVGNNMGRYHRSRDCHYLSNNISSVSYDDIEDHKSSSGSRYKPCGVCGKSASSGSSVYVMPNGSYYHSRKDCSSIAYYVREVPLSEVEHLGACSYCGKTKGNR